MDLTNQFLIAMPALQDPNFHRTVTYLCAHNHEGAMGIVINRPLDLNLGEVLDHMSIEVENVEVNDMMVLQGGPVQRDRGFVIHEPAGQWDAVLTVGNEIGVATSRDILTAVAHGDGPERAVVAYEKRYESAARLLGVDLDRLSGEAGHA
jgi:putative transcriptional regulator